MQRYFISLWLILLFSGCSSNKILQKEPAPKFVTLNTVSSRQLSPKQQKILLKESGKNWLYGEGVGNTLVTIGASIIFPPYAIYATGNTVLEIAGYKKLEVTSLLPNKLEKKWNTLYSTVASSPGRLLAKANNEEFRDKEVASKIIRNCLSDTQDTEKTTEEHTQTALNLYASYFNSID